MGNLRIRAYKVFNSDWTCLKFQYAVGEEYHHDGDVEMCKSGFHACLKLADCFSYYSFDPNNKVAGVELWGETITNDSDSKIAASNIRIVRELSWLECLELCNTGNSNTGNRNTGNRNTGNWNTGNRNTGNWNTGYCNTGDRNTGDRNTGNWNTGDRNTGDRNTGYCNTGNDNTGHSNAGDRNTGNWNGCNYETGHFNSINSETIRVFNKPCDRRVWDNAEKPEFIHFDLCLWVESDRMTDEEKERYPKHVTTGGYVKKMNYNDAWKRAWDNASDDDKRLLYRLPNFDPGVFEAISGIDVTSDDTWDR